MHPNAGIGYPDTPPLCLCGSDNLELDGLKFANGRALYRCCRCGLRQLFPYPVANNQDSQPYSDPTYLPNIGEAEYFGYFMALYRSTLWRMLDRRSRILDFGAGHCFYHKFLNDLGHDDVTSLEVNRVLAERAKRDLGLESVFTSLAAVNHLRFDLIIANQVIEHVHNPRVLLDEELHPLLNPGGRIVLTVPNAASLNRTLLGKQWIGYSPAEHIWFFGETCASRVFEQSRRFRVVETCVRSAVNTRHDRFRARSLPKRLYYNTVMRFFELVGRGDQLIIVLERARAS